MRFIWFLRFTSHYPFRWTKWIGSERREWTKGRQKQASRNRGFILLPGRLLSIPFTLSFHSSLSSSVRSSPRRFASRNEWKEIREEKWQRGTGDVVSWEVKEHYHKDNLRHLPRFPGFFVTFRILVTSLYILLSCRVPRGGWVVGG